MTTKRSQPSMLRSLVWKETWQLKEFFIAMVGLAAFLQFLLTIVAGFTSQPSVFIAIAIAGGFVALFAAACGATLYATEKETGTFQNLQLLPINSRQLATGKLIAALALCLAFLLAGIVIAFASVQLWGGKPIMADSRSTPWLVAFIFVFGLAAVEFFAWSWLFSLLTSKPLNAAMLGIFFASLGIQISVLLSGQINADFASLEPYENAWPWRLPIAAVVLLAGVIVSGNWLRSSNQGQRARARTDRPGRKRLVNVARRNTPVLGRLTWQTMRQSRVSVPSAMAISFGFGVMMTAFNPNLLVWTLPIMVAAGGYAGFAAFSPDQKLASKRFLSSRGVSPLRVWLSRVIPWAFTISLAYVLLLLAAIFVATVWAQYSVHTLMLEIRTVGFFAVSSAAISVFFIVGVLLCFAAGQFVSIAMPSRILAAVVTMTVCFPLVYWLTLMILGGVPLWWSVLPIALALLLAGYLSFRGLLLERSHVSTAIIPSILVLSVVTLTSVGVAWHRANEIPAVSPQFSRKGDADPAIVREIEKRFLAVLSSIDDPEVTVEDLRLNELELEVARHENGEKTTSVFRGTDAEQWLDENDKKWRIDKLQDLQTKLLFENNQAQLRDLRAAIDFAASHEDQLVTLQPGLNKDTRELNQVFRFGIIWRLLCTSFEFNLRDGRLDTAWLDLKALTRALRIKLVIYPQDRNWYSLPMKYLQDFTLADGVTEELLREANDFAIREFQPIDAERVLEYQYHELRGDRDVNFPHSNRELYNIAKWLQNLPFERERTRRLINLQCAIQLEQLETQRRRREFAERRLNLAADRPTWLQPFVDVATELELRKLNLRHKSSFKNQDTDQNPFLDSGLPQWMQGIQENDFRFWSITTIFPHPDEDSDYFYDLIDVFLRRDLERRDYDRFYLDRKQLTLLQIWFVLYKKLNGKFPSDLSISNFFSLWDRGTGLPDSLKEPDWPRQIIIGTSRLRHSFDQFQIQNGINGYFEKKFFFQKDGWPIGFQVTYNNSYDYFSAQRPFISNRWPTRKSGESGFEIPARDPARPFTGFDPPAIVPLVPRKDLSEADSIGRWREFTIRLPSVDSRNEE